MIVITGASKGIGNYLLKSFTADGEKVVGTYNTTLPDLAVNDLFIKLDVSNFDKTKTKLLDLLNDQKEIVLINCAGINYNAFAHKADIDKWQSVIDVNLTGTFKVINCLLPLMRKNKYGRIINFSSVVPALGVSGTSAYSASKSALWGMSRAICAENAINGITINNLNLGYFEIGMLNQIPSDILESIKNKIPCKQFGQPKDIYVAVKFLIECSYINGASIDINGGII